MSYIWQQNPFPDFQFKIENFMEQIQEFSLEIGETNGLYQNVSEEHKVAILLQIAVTEACKTSEIEGEYFSREDIRSSLQKQLGLSDFAVPLKDKKAKAISNLVLKVREDHSKRLSLEMMKEWHRILMKEDKTVNEGNWRISEAPMQIISGRFGKINIHFEAPPSKHLPELMTEFINWYHTFPYENLGSVARAMFKSALVHLYFETLHPFQDGNGRIGRFLSEKTMIETLGFPILISLSKCIEKNKNQYYEALKSTQNGGDISKWLQFFFKIFIESIKENKEIVHFVIKKVNYFDTFKSQLNNRELKVIGKMTENGLRIFEGGMTSKKYISIAKTSKATATRDLQHLFEIAAFTKMGEGRSVNYQINWELF